MDTKDIGDLAEVAVCKEIKSIGNAVLTPFGDNQPYDLVMDNGEALIKVQVKSGRLKNGCVEAHLESASHNNTDGTYHTQYDNDEIDYFAIYCSELDSVYFISIEDSPETQVKLRVDEPSVSNPNIRWASDYNISETFK